MAKGDKEILKADPEDGITPIANLLLAAIAIAKLTGKEKGAILYLCRRTYGWQFNNERLKEAQITLTEWARVLHADSSKASQILASLVNKGIFKREFLGAGKSYLYTINTRVAEWDKGCLNLQVLSEIERQPLPKTTRHALPKTTTPIGSNQAQGNKVKEILKKYIYIPYPEFPNVNKMTKEEHQKLIALFREEGTRDRVENLSLYIASKGDKYKNHYATILAWEKRDKKGGRDGTHRGSPRTRKIPQNYRTPEEIFGKDDD